MLGWHGNEHSRTWKRPYTWPIKMFLVNLIRCGGGVKGLIVTWSNLVVTWKVRTKMGIVYRSPLGLRWFTCVWLYFGYSLAIEFSNCALKKGKKKKMNTIAVTHFQVLRIKFVEYFFDIDVNHVANDEELDNNLLTTCLDTCIWISYPKWTQLHTAIKCPCSYASRPCVYMPYAYTSMPMFIGPNDPPTWPMEPFSPKGGAPWN